MRLLSMILALGAIVWVMYQSSGGGQSETVIPQGHIDAMQKAKDLEQTIQVDALRRLEGLEQE